VRAETSAPDQLAGGLPRICAMDRDFARAAVLTWRRTAAIREGNVAMAAAEKMGGRFLTA